MLTDDFDREVTGVRISLTDRCNFDCVYCHNEGLGDTRGPMEPQDDEIGTDDVVRFLEVVADYGVDAAKITGGEPLLRKDVEEIVRRAPDEIEISLTTNGTMLPGRAQDLADAGLDRVNISLDAMDPEEFEAVTQTGSFKAVLDGVDAALDALLDPVKLNMVVFEATAPQVPKMVDYVAEKDGMQLQLIEYMPELTGHADWTVDMDRVHGWLEEQADQIEQREMHGRKRYFVDGGMVEIVDPVGNADFCANCHRVRVTHDGKLKGCLNRNDDLRSMGEMTTDEIRQTFEETVANRVPYYGEYMVKNDQGEWVVNDAYCEQPASAD